MRAHWFLAASLLYFGCSSQLPPVSIASVVPGGMVASQPTQVSVQVLAELAFQVDYSQGTLSADSQMQVLVGPLQLGSGTYSPGGLVQGTLPTVIPTGTYNVSVTMGDGRTAVSPDAFTVDGGTWPRAYVVDPIGDQRSSTPFSVTLRAVGGEGPGGEAFGGEASDFAGNVLLDITGNGTLLPQISEAFDAGVCVQTVTVTGTGEFTLLVSDITGSNGQSAPFTVAP